MHFQFQTLKFQFFDSPKMDFAKTQKHNAKASCNTREEALAKAVRRAREASLLAYVYEN